MSPWYARAITLEYHPAPTGPRSIARGMSPWYARAITLESNAALNMPRNRKRAADETAIGKQDRKIRRILGALRPQRPGPLEPAARRPPAPPRGFRGDLGRNPARPEGRAQASIDRVLAGKAAIDGVPADFDKIAQLLGESAATSGDPERLKAWWVYRMLFGPDPLTERLALLWHNHFATSNLKVGSLAQMHTQNELFRQLGRGPFAALLGAVVHDPAMLIWLDAPSNRKGHPNENLARELMELFSLGVGHYTEHDVKEAAPPSQGGASTTTPSPSSRSATILRRRPSLGRPGAGRATIWCAWCSSTRQRPVASPGGSASCSSRRRP